MPLDDVAVTPLDPDRFREVLTPEGLSDFERAMARGRELLEGRTFWNVNSTAHGGGVAEMLRSLIGYVRGLGIDGRWVTIGGTPEFFDITKRLHNRLHGYTGDGGPLGDAERAAYERVTAEHAELLAQRVAPSDVVLLHDPQTAGMVAPLVEKGVPVIWRAHIGLDEPNDLAREAWRFLIGYMERADAYVFSRPGYTWEGLDVSKVTVIAPSIDAFSPKNHAMSFTSVTAVLRAVGLAADHHHHSRAIFERLDGSLGRVQHEARVVEERALRLDVPLLAQVSRWDRLKDPLGIVTAFAEHVHADEEPHLLLAGPDVTAVADDPEGAAVFDEIEAVWHELPQRVRRRVHLALLPMDEADENAVMVNALQRRADVVAQKSLAEGFGLTVAEAMWKGRPVVASDVGGIQDQIEDGQTGYLVEATDLPAFADRVNRLLADPHDAERMGVAAQTRVRDLFLGPRHLGQYVTLLESVLER
ncbi:MAG TPA: glycosyltransferase [Solirubrobacteraceae bacterium]|jgi:trehalose synthase|nr:glycosyltransferase [Solirubrobacteraceae bacterium]